MCAVAIQTSGTPKPEGTAAPVSLLILKIACANTVKKHAERKSPLQPRFLSKLIKTTGDD